MSEPDGTSGKGERVRVTTNSERGGECITVSRTYYERALEPSRRFASRVSKGCLNITAETVAIPATMPAVMFLYDTSMVMLAHPLDCLDLVIEAAKVFTEAAAFMETHEPEG